jgi:hypothetical protein
MNKYCSFCKKIKNSSEFYFNRCRKDKLGVYCKKCSSIYSSNKYSKQLTYKKCKKCGKEFLGSKNKLCCQNKDCRYKDRIKGIDGYKECLWCKSKFPYRKSLKKRGYNKIGYINQKFCSKKCALIFRNKSIEQKEKVSKKLKGKPSKLKGIKLSLKQRVERSKRNKGKKSHFWKGGITNKNKIIRMSLNYKLWRKAVFERDNYICVFCGQRGEKLQADHIKPFAYFPKFRFDISNGRTLCENCHKKTSTYLKNDFLRKQEITAGQRLG